MPPAGGPLVERAVFLTVDALVVAFAWFTLLAQLWNVLDWPVRPLMIVWLLSTGIPIVAVVRLDRWRLSGTHVPPGWTDRLPSFGARGSTIAMAIQMIAALVAALLLAQGSPVAWTVG